MVYHIEPDHIFNFVAEFCLDPVKNIYTNGLTHAVVGMFLGLKPDERPDRIEEGPLIINCILRQ